VTSSPRPPPAGHDAPDSAVLSVSEFREVGRSDTTFSDDAVRAIHADARGLLRAINRLAVTALLAACAVGKTIVDESSARAAISEEAAAATD
jgi:hypothetical protein